jgi:hypothetical protein
MDSACAMVFVAYAEDPDALKVWRYVCMCTNSSISLVCVDYICTIYVYVYIFTSVAAPLRRVREPSPWLVSYVPGHGQLDRVQLAGRRMIINTIYSHAGGGGVFYESNMQYKYSIIHEVSMVWRSERRASIKCYDLSLFPAYFNGLKT